ncbi:MAG: hypothetical protein AUK47_14360 [Deltaproteobacteria bacterium CG2_30_63_29]|nr:MAG: hypothetical protein AUK47_14360 [Deltaproteobacteria bacterium CG2_30_63_29]PJB45217.1 MAG: hypothetical protein CO108_07680 [Deltaproteobacteria bacterium CG_4_9_14_3_um_filter_63_12]
MSEYNRAKTDFCESGVHLIMHELDEAKQPTQLGPYRILRFLGRGGIAEVYEAVIFGASGFEKHVALKVLRPQWRGDARMERALIEEAKLGARLSHRNLVGVHQLGVDQGIYYLCMDLIHGWNLRSLTREVRSPIPVILHIADEMLAGLQYIHEFEDSAGRPLGLVHRDVTPSNILCTKEGGVCLSDLGIAKPTKELDKTWNRFLKGKYAYMSPEQLGSQEISSAADQWGFGVTLAELLSGVRPFDGATAIETMEKIRQADFPKLKLPRKLRPIVRTCLEKEPSQRFASTALLRDAISEARGHWPPCDSRGLKAWLAEASAAVSK